MSFQLTIKYFQKSVILIYWLKQIEFEILFKWRRDIQDHIWIFKYFYLKKKNSSLEKLQSRQKQFKISIFIFHHGNDSKHLKSAFETWPSQKLNLQTKLSDDQLPAYIYRDIHNVATKTRRVSSSMFAPLWVRGDEWSNWHFRITENPIKWHNFVRSPIHGLSLIWRADIECHVSLFTNT